MRSMILGSTPPSDDCRAEDEEKLNRKLHVDLTSAQARVAALESREVIAVEALKQAKDEHVQKLMKAYLVTHNQLEPCGSKSLLYPTLFNPSELNTPRFLKVTWSLSGGGEESWELPEGA
ncbi:hypothetical protein Zm00014a_033421 [Zea mays]|uniref:Uncharacterized protein n=1 Tax=Zea mays TaxID=4577 RepID=A0A3L6DRS1_MAIZE|nr:hypothetical protein Zm00014a_033421 [Zea mays]